MNRNHLDSWTFDNWGRLKNSEQQATDSVLDQLENDDPELETEAGEPSPTVGRPPTIVNCDVCGKQYKSLAGMRLHKRRTICGATPVNGNGTTTPPKTVLNDDDDENLTPRKRSLRTKQLAEEHAEENGTEEPESITPESIEPSEPQNYCHICQKEFVNSTGLKYGTNCNFIIIILYFSVHITKTHKNNINQSNNRASSVEIGSLQSGGSEGGSSDEGGTKRGKYERGLDGSRIERTCPICKEVFMTAKNYRDHLKSHDMGKHLEHMPQFACPDCGKTFRQHSNMRRHYRIHTGNSINSKIFLTSFYRRNAISMQTV